MKPLCALLLLACLGCGDSPPPPLDERAQLRRFLVEEASQLPDPWVKAHLLLALGPDAGDPPGSLLAELTATVVVDGERRPYFPVSSGGRRCDAHPNMSLVVLERLGLPADRRFATSYGQISLGQLRQAALARLQLDSPGYQAESGWSLYLIGREPSETLPDGRAREPFVVAEIERVLAAQSAIAASAANGRLVKDKSGIFAHPCGGFHFIQGAFSLPSGASLQARVRERVPRQWELLQLRLEHEPPLYAQARDVPDAKLPPNMSRAQWHAALDVQALKFYGHWLETVAQLVEDGLLTRDARVQEAAGVAVEGLRQVVQRLIGSGLFGSLAARYADPASQQLAYDLVGDASHAYHGWSWWQRLP